MVLSRQPQYAQKIDHFAFGMFVEHFPGDSNFAATPQIIYPIGLDTFASRMSYQDQAEFVRLLNFFAYADDRNKRNFGMSTFVKHLNMVHNFVVKGDSGNAYRGIVCGILFGNGFILVNTTRLKKLMYRSKSCVNGCFQRLGFSISRATQDIGGFFEQLVPQMAHQLNTRQWCVRKASENITLCFVPNIPNDFVQKLGFIIPDSYKVSESAPLSPKDEEIMVHSATNRPESLLNNEEFNFDIANLLNHPREPSSIPRMLPRHTF